MRIWTFGRLLCGCLCVVATLVMSGVATRSQTVISGNQTSGAAPVGASKAKVTPSKKSLVESDPRLVRQVTIVIRDRPLSELLNKLTDLTAVKLMVSPSIETKKITAIVRGVPVATVMAQAGYLYDCGWKRILLKGQIAYRLEPQPGMRRRAQSLRDDIVDASIKQVAAQEWRDMEPALDAWITSHGDIDALREVDPEMAEAIVADPRLENQLNGMAAMPPGGRYIWFVDQMKYASEIRGPNVIYAMVKEYLAGKPRPVGSSDPAFKRKVDVKLSGGSSLAAALEGLSKATRINFVADSHTKRASVKTLDWKNTSVNEILDTIADETESEWIQSSNFVRFRSRTWFMDELREVPESVAKRWKALKEKQGRLYFEDYLGLIDSFTLDQLGGLADSGDLYNLSEEAAVAIRYLPQFRFYGQFDAVRQRAAWSDDGLSMLEMSPSQQQAFLGLMTSERPLAGFFWLNLARLYLRQEGSQGYEIIFEFDAEGRPWLVQRVLLPVPKSKTTTSSTDAAAQPPAADTDSSTPTADGQYQSP